MLNCSSRFTFLLLSLLCCVSACKEGSRGIGSASPVVQKNKQQLEEEDKKRSLYPSGDAHRSGDRASLSSDDDPLTPKDRYDRLVGFLDRCELNQAEKFLQGLKQNNLHTQVVNFQSDGNLVPIEHVVGSMKTCLNRAELLELLFQYDADPNGSDAQNPIFHQMLQLTMAQANFFTSAIDTAVFKVFMKQKNST